MSRDLAASSAGVQMTFIATLHLLIIYFRQRWLHRSALLVGDIQTKVSERIDAIQLRQSSSRRGVDYFNDNLKPLICWNLNALLSAQFYEDRYESGASDKSKPNPGLRSDGTPCIFLGEAS